MININNIRKYFIEELKNERFTTDKTGQKTIELIGASFLADEPAIFGTPNREYIDREIDWYCSGSTNIRDIYGGDADPPQAWQYAANEHGEINSNYGRLIFDDIYYRQYENVLTELRYNVDTRRATMVYNRPSIWAEYLDRGKNDFICTNAVTYYIRTRHRLSAFGPLTEVHHCGYKNDYAWQQYVLEMLAGELEIKPGFIQWQVQNLHVYERHFNLVK